MPTSTAAVSPAELIATAQLHEAQGRLAAAEAAYSKVLVAHPEHPDILRALALIAHRRGQATAARRFIERSIAAAPRAETLLILAGLCLAQRRFGDAHAACERAAGLAPDDPAPWLEMAGVHVATQDYVAAESALRQALRLRRDLPDAQASLASVLFSQARFDDAASACRQLLAAYPTHAVGWKNLGAAERALGNFTAARQAYATAIRCAPEFAEAQRDLGLLELLMGEAKQGFQRYEWRWRAMELGAPLLQSPRWDGGNAAGKTILLHFEQGFGDSIQCLRFVPLVAERCKAVILRLPRPLVRLAGCLSGFARVVAETEPLPRHDVHAYLLSLPHLLGLVGPTEPAGAPYLTPPAARAAVWRNLLAGVAGKRVGIAWSGNPTHSNDRQRSIPADALEPMFGLQGCTVYSLHPDADPPTGIARLPARLTDFAETAAAIVNLDLVIAVDTAVAHLAGALGRPVWILLPAVPDWRWRLNADTSPWYQTARLFRQPVPGDWPSVIEQVRTELAQFIGAP